MHDIMVKPLPPGCRLTAIFDVSDMIVSLYAADSFTVMSLWLGPG